MLQKFFNIAIRAGKSFINILRNFNPKALLFGPFFYFWLGMTRRGAFFLTCACVCWLGAILLWQDGLFERSIFMIVFPFVFCAFRVNFDYRGYCAYNSNYNSEAQTLYYSISLPRLFICSVLSGGIYDMYWSYRQWRAIKRYQHAHISPVLRSLALLLFIYPLFRKIYHSAEALRYIPRFPAGLAALAYMFIMTTGSAENYDSLSSGGAFIIPSMLCLSALSLFPAQKAINFNNARINGSLKFEPVHWYEVLITFIGMLFMTAYFIGNWFLYGYQNPNILY